MDTSGRGIIIDGIKSPREVTRIHKREIFILVRPSCRLPREWPQV